MQQLFFASIMALTLAACGASSGNLAKGTDGPDGSRSFAAQDFTGVELAGSDDVIVKQGAAFSVVATGKQAVLDKLEVSVADGVLQIRRKPSNFSWSDDDGATITVTLPTLTHAEVSGSGDMMVDRAAGDAVKAILSGSGNLEVAAVEASKVNVTLAGSGDLAIKGGKSAKGDISLAGSGDIDTSGLMLADAEVSVAGSGDVRLTATATADVSIVGSGDVKVGGGAKCDSNQLGSGSVSCS
jgi:Putative auto-transporter adhesin, head GIN domain